MSLAPRPSPIAPGYKLDRYELLCPIAEGGMASVWIARQTGKHGFQKLVAVKTILPRFASDPKFQQMFVDEARIASRIEHVNVAQILDVGEQHDVTYLVMEYVDGDALSKVHRAARKRGGLIPPGVVLRLMADVCGGLHAAHDLRGEDGQLLHVVHRDVSPQNILVNTKGVAKLIDFGIAKARDRVAGDTNAETLKGKIQYMAPEQAVGRPLDRRADVWAIGAVLYHLLSGRPPYEAENDVQTLFLLSSGRPPMPVRGVHPAVLAVVRRALSHAPEARFPTAAAMQQAIEEAIAVAGLGTSTAMIVSYLADQVGDRVEKRRSALAVGLAAAEERERLAAVMAANTDRGTSPGTLDSTAQLVLPRPPALPSNLAELGVTTTETLGSAAIVLEPPLRRAGLRFAIVGAFVGAGLAILLLVAVLATRKPETVDVRAAAMPPRPTVTAAPPLPAEPPPVVPPPAPMEPETVVAASALPVAQTAPAHPPPPSISIAPVTTTALPVMAPPGSVASRPPAPSARPPTPTSTRVNDGF